MTTDISDYALAAAWKHENAPGIRFFQDPARPAKLGLPAVRVHDFAMVWPEALGPTPTLKQLDTWVQEWKADQAKQEP